MVMVRIGTKIKENRWRQGLTLKELSEKSSVSVGLLSQIERGVSASSIRNIQKIVRALGISFASLFEESGPEKNNSERQSVNNKTRTVSIVRGS